MKKRDFAVVFILAGAPVIIPSKYGNLVNNDHDREIQLVL